jgi:peptide/nickel transport system substrate-binding protein/oligopeptide transport system substrate-binding protein
VDVDEIDRWFPNALDIHPFKYLSFKAYKPLPGVTVVPETGANLAVFNQNK